MSTKRAAKLAIVHDTEERQTSSRTQTSNALRLKIDHLKTFTPLTDNQKLFYDAYKRGDYFMALHGVAGTGKTFIAVYKALEEVLDKNNPFNKIIIVDEMQNMTFEEIDTVMTRVGYRSKIIWCGDYRQTDLNKKKSDVSGILKFFDIAHHMHAFTRIEFLPADIVRSSLVKDYIIAKLQHEDSND